MTAEKIQCPCITCGEPSLISRELADCFVARGVEMRGECDVCKFKTDVLLRRVFIRMGAVMENGYWVIRR